MRIIGWKAGQNINEREFSFLSDEPTDEGNWITMVVGKNGTKKSLLLRALLDGFLGNSEFRHGIRPPIPTLVALANNGAIKSRAIAISGTPFDRFPRQNRFSSQKISSGKYDNVGVYYYLGLSAANGTIGTNQSVRTLAHLLLSANKDSKKLFSAVKSILNFSGFNKGVYVVIKRSPSINYSKKDVSENQENVLGKFSCDNFQRQSEIKIKGDYSAECLKVLRRINIKMKDEVYREKFISTLTNMPASIGFLFNQNGLKKISNKIEIPIEDVVGLLESGMLIASHVASDIVSNPVESKARSSDNKPPEGDAGVNGETPIKVLTETDMSSGQWQLFSSLLGLALTVRDNSLVVIDEPENSLHPDWQRSYVKLLSDVLANRKGCHVVIATHSPLIASGVDGKNGNAIRMRRSTAGSMIGDSEPISITFGWNANDVYDEIFGLETPRASSFTDLADEALSLLRDKDVASKKLAKIIEELMATAKLLPDTDSMRQVIFSMESAYKSMLKVK